MIYEHVLMRIDKTKEVFKDICCNNALIQVYEVNYFNLLEGHVMTHYSKYICLYGSLIRYTIGVKEAWHITQLKQFFKQTNKQKRFEIQNLNHNI